MAASDAAARFVVSVADLLRELTQEERVMMYHLALKRLKEALPPE